MSEREGLVFGVMAEPIADQLRSQGVTFPSGGIDHCQRDADAVSRLAVRGILTEAEARAARRRLMGRIRYLVKRDGVPAA